MTDLPEPISGPADEHDLRRLARARREVGVEVPERLGRGRERLRERHDAPGRRRCRRRPDAAGLDGGREVRHGPDDGEALVREVVRRVRPRVRPVADGGEDEADEQPEQRAEREVERLLGRRRLGREAGPRGWSGSRPRSVVAASSVASSSGAEAEQRLRRRVAVALERGDGDLLGGDAAELARRLGEAAREGRRPGRARPRGPPAWTRSGAGCPRGRPRRWSPGCSGPARPRLMADCAAAPRMRWRSTEGPSRRVCIWARSGCARGVPRYCGLRWKICSMRRSRSEICWSSAVVSTALGAAAEAWRRGPADGEVLLELRDLRLLRADLHAREVQLGLERADVRDRRGGLRVEAGGVLARHVVFEARLDRVELALAPRDLLLERDARLAHAAEVGVARHRLVLLREERRDEGRLGRRAGRRLDADGVGVLAGGLHRDDLALEVRARRPRPSAARRRPRAASRTVERPRASVRLSSVWAVFCAISGACWRMSAWLRMRLWSVPVACVKPLLTLASVPVAAGA